MKIVEPSVKLEWITPDAIRHIELAARTCYKSEPTDEASGDFVRRIGVQKGHESVLEHASASYRIITDRGVTHEIVRHRIASYSQESTRYVNYSKEKFGSEISVIKPQGLTMSQEDNWLRAVHEAERMYIGMINNGATPQIARSVLPNCTKTEIVMTTNFREWLHFLKLRTSKAAHPDMRVIAGLIGNDLAKRCPDLFGAYEFPKREAV